MPCNSDYMDPRPAEVKLSQVACLLDELGGTPIDRNHWEGYHPKIYDKVIAKEGADALVAELCEKLKTTEVGDYSLAMQTWWKRHKRADKKRESTEEKAPASSQDYDDIIEDLREELKKDKAPAYVQVYDEIIKDLEKELKKANKLASQRGARLQLLRESMREIDWLHFVTYEQPQAKNWFESNGAPVK